MLDIIQLFYNMSPVYLKLYVDCLPHKNVFSLLHMVIVKASYPVLHACYTFEPMEVIPHNHANVLLWQYFCLAVSCMGGKDMCDVLDADSLWLPLPEGRNRPSL
jgi:hypothetical protein